VGTGSREENASEQETRQRRKIAPGSVKMPGKAGIYQPILAH